MLSKILIAPSLNSLFFTGILLLVLFFIVIQNFKQISRFRLYEKISILSLLAIAIGVHGLIHLGVEKQYGFNPYNRI